MRWIMQGQWLPYLLLFAGCLPSSSPEKKTPAGEQQMSVQADSRRIAPEGKTATGDTVTLAGERQMSVQADSQRIALEEDTFYIPQAANIQVLSLTSTTNGTTDALICAKWHLTTAAVKTIIRNGQPVDGPTIHDLYLVLSCETSGLVAIDKDTFHYRINAGSFFYLYNEQHSGVYICPAESCRRFFLSAEQNPEED